MPDNILYYGDNLDVLQKYVQDESVDLIYLDPPFNSNASYNVLFSDKGGTRSAAQLQAFKDTWSMEEAVPVYQRLILDPGPVGRAIRAFGDLLPHGGLLAYLVMMAPRLAELHRVLKPTGSLYLHCDPTASHYLKVLLDAIFGLRAFRSEICWKRAAAHSGALRPAAVHDILLLYTKSDAWIWNQQYQPYDAEYLETFYEMRDSDGRRWKRTDLTGAGVTKDGPTGRPWRGIDVSAKGRHWAYPPEELDRLDREGQIHWPEKKGGMPRLKQYADSMPGVALQDVWADIRPIHNLSDERLSYATQKPEALLERIINASSNAGDLVLDPFCGCGTTVAVAQRLGRRWIGIDITQAAIVTMRARLAPIAKEGVDYCVIGEPTTVPDAEALAREDPYQFQWWALGLVGARPDPGQQRKGADRGIDGRLYFDDTNKGIAKQVILSVKGGEHVSVGFVRDLRGVLEREGAEIGVLICMQAPTGPMVIDAAEAGVYQSPLGTQHPRLQILTVAELLDGKRIDMPRGVNVTFAQGPRARKPRGTQGQLDLG